MTNVDSDGVLKDVFIRTRFNYDTDSVSRGTGLVSDVETRTQQQFKEECDINTIVERFGVTGQLPNNLRMPISDEFVDTIDYQTSLDKIREANEAFMQLPAVVRTRFQNDAGQFVAFASDPKNLDQCREWGLAMPKAMEPEIPTVKIWTEPEKPGTGVDGK